MQKLFKILSVLSLFLILIPGEKFSLYYGAAIIIGFLEGFNNVLSGSFALCFLSLLAIVLVFFKELKYNVLGYLILLLSLYFVTNHSKGDLNYEYWLPLVVYIVLAFITVIRGVLVSKKAKLL